MSLPVGRPLSMAIQQACIRERFPQFSYSHTKNAWTGTMRPTSQSAKYLVEISYRPYSVPNVFVLKPRLHPDAPHVYKANGSLCLYYPEDKSWSSRKLLGNTIFLWTAEWLYYYELWLATGRWFGPEAPHNNGIEVS